MNASSKANVDRVRMYREFCSALDAMARELSDIGDFVGAAHVQAALDSLRKQAVASEN